MPSVADAIRDEGRARYEQGEIKLPAVASWMKVAEFVESTGGQGFDEDVLAEALRIENVDMNGHPSQPWDQIPEQNRDLWRHKARRVLEALDTANKRRGT